MADNITPSLLTLPIDLIYRILDQLQPYNILVSVRNVSSRLDAIMDMYHRYQVNFHIQSQGLRL